MTRFKSTEGKTDRCRPGGGGTLVYQYTPRKVPKIPENTQNVPQYTQNWKERGIRLHPKLVVNKTNDILNTQISA